MSKEVWRIGDVTVTKVVEMEFWTPLTFLDELLPSSSRSDIAALDWLNPSHLLDDRIHMGVYSFLVETPTHKVVVDTGVGNSKRRSSDMWNMLDTEYLANLRSVWDPDDVDFVVCTHMHIDHVGWNTILSGGQWVPTFRNATYVMVEQEYAHWKRLADDNDSVDPRLDVVAVFDDSVRPIVDAGLARFVGPATSITPEIKMIPSHGHTPGHVSVLIESGGESAVITGDLLHFPCQVGYPAWSNVHDVDPETAATTRRVFLERFADTSTMVIGTHFGTPTGGLVTRDGAAFRLSPAH